MMKGCSIDQTDFISSTLNPEATTYNLYKLISSKDILLIKIINLR